MNLRRNLFGALLCALGLLAPAVAGLVGISGSRYTPSESWQLPAANFEDSGVALAIISTLEDADTAAWAYHRRMPTVYTRTVPVVPAFGCPPYHFTYTGPAWGSINDTDGDVGEGDITFTSPQVGTHAVSVRVQDQCSGDITVEWTAEVISRDNTTYFIHVDGDAAGGGSGTSSSPYNDIGDVLGPNDAATTHQNKQVLLLGTLTLCCQSASYDLNSSRLIINANKPLVWVGLPGEDAVLRGSADNVDGAGFWFEGGDDVFFAGITWTNPHTNGAVDGSQERNFWMSISYPFTLWGNTFDFTTTPGDPGANSTAAFIQNVSGVVIAKNRYLNCEYIGPFTVYDTTNMAVVRNELSDGTNGCTTGFFWKGGDAIENIWAAFNYGTGNTGAASSFAKVECIDINPPSPWPRGPIVFMHNRYVSEGQGIWLLPATDCLYTIVSKRNSWKISNHYFQASNLLTGSSTGVWDTDSIEHNGSYTQGVRDAGAGATITRGPDNDHGTSGIVDDTTGLQEGGPDCTHGAEICTSSLLDVLRLLEAANDPDFELRLAA